MKGAQLVILDGGAQCCYFALAGAKRALRKREIVGMGRRF